MTQTKLLEAKEQVLQTTAYSKLQWTELLMDLGLDFAKSFSHLFQDPATIYKQLTSTPAPEGDKNNQFWSWWIFNWLLDDRQYIEGKFDKQQMSYQQYKQYMVGNESLEKQLLEDINNNNSYFFNQIKTQ